MSVAWRVVACFAWRGLVRTDLYDVVLVVIAVNVGLVEHAVPKPFAVTVDLLTQGRHTAQPDTQWTWRPPMLMGGGHVVSCRVVLCRVWLTYVVFLAYVFFALGVDGRPAALGHHLDSRRLTLLLHTHDPTNT